MMQGSRGFSGPLPFVCEAENHMSDMNPYQREEQKQRLRRNMIVSEDPELDTGEEAEEKPFRPARGRRKFGRLKIVLIVLCLIAALAGAWHYYQTHHRFSGYTQVWSRQIPSTEGSFTGYRKFGSNVLRYTKDGASYIDGSGDVIWSISYQMKAPICSVNGDFAAIADQQGNEIYICDTAKNHGKATTLLPIMRVSISAYGVVAALTEDSTSSYVSFFKNDGSDLDWGIKTVMSGNGYMLDAALSPDGTQVMISDVHVNSGQLGNRIVFYNFSEYGKSYPDRLVGGFDEFGSHLCPRVRFFSDRRAAAFAGGQIAFFSLENVTSPELTQMVDVKDEIKAVAASDRYAAVITADGTGEYPNRLLVFNTNGRKIADTGISYSWQEMDIADDFIILRNSDSCEIIGTNGKLRFEGSFDTPVSMITKGKKPGTLLLTGGNTVSEIKLR